MKGSHFTRKEFEQDHLNKRFGRLVVKGYFRDTNNKQGNSRIYYICKCDCGRETSVWKTHLLNGDVKSCGCLKREMQKEKMLKRWNA